MKCCNCIPLKKLQQIKEKNGFYLSWTFFECLFRLSSLCGYQKISDFHEQVECVLEYLNQKLTLVPKIKKMQSICKKRTDLKNYE